MPFPVPATSSNTFTPVANSFALSATDNVALAKRASVPNDLTKILAPFLLREPAPKPVAINSKAIGIISATLVDQKSGSAREPQESS